MNTGIFLTAFIITIPCVMALLYKSAKSRGRSGNWMWWGIHPIVGLIALAVLLRRPRIDIQDSDAPTVLTGLTYGQGTAIVVILVLIFFLPFFRATRILPPMEWKYQIVSISDNSLDSKLDALGSSGWELVFARRVSDGSSSPTFSYEIILKRPSNPSN